MKITNLEKKAPEIGDLLIMTSIRYNISSTVRLIISDDGERVGLLDLEDGEITTSFYDSFNQLYVEVLKNCFDYEVVPKSQLELIIHR